MWEEEVDCWFWTQTGNIWQLIRSPMAIPRTQFGMNPVAGGGVGWGQSWSSFRHLWKEMWGRGDLFYSKGGGVCLKPQSDQG